MAGFPPGLGLLGYAPSLPFIFFLKIFTCLFVWLCRVLFVVCGIFVESCRLSSCGTNAQ